MYPTAAAYLNHLNLTAGATPTYAYLAALQEAHMLTVPFENLSVVRGEAIVLDEALLIAKIVERMRGGFCFELNGAFCCLLRWLGFDVVRIAAGVKTEEGYTPYRDHMALLVDLEQPYLVDVGFGDSVRCPVPLNGETRVDVSGAYRVVLDADAGYGSHQKDEKAEAVYLLQKAADEAWLTQYRFTTIPQSLTDYQARCDFLAISPDSNFTQRTVCSLATPTGRISLSREHLTVTENGQQTKVPIETEAAFDAALERHFGIALRD
jgi:N-hydroxyarylamine O-acetyltransferase